MDSIASTIRRIFWPLNPTRQFPDSDSPAVHRDGKVREKRRARACYSAQGQRLPFSAPSPPTNGRTRSTANRGLPTALHQTRLRRVCVSAMGSELPIRQATLESCHRRPTHRDADGLAGVRGGGEVLAGPQASRLLLGGIGSQDERRKNGAAARTALSRQRVPTPRQEPPRSGMRRRTWHTSVPLLRGAWRPNLCAALLTT